MRSFADFTDRSILERSVYDTTLNFYLRTRTLFSELAQLTDREYVKYWGEPPQADSDSYSWFASVANALNKAMCRDLFLAESVSFFDYVNSVLSQCDDEVANCIDVSLVENLFWRVPLHQAAPYWNILPQPLQKLYLEFHKEPPVVVDRPTPPALM